MKAKTMLIALMTVALIGANVAVGYAGGGGSGNPGGILLWQCYEAHHGPNPAHVLEVNDQFINPTKEKVGKLKMVCAPADFSILNDQDYNVALTADHITCYEAPGAHATESDVLLSDAFGQGQPARVKGASKLICVLAEKTCQSGCPVTGP